MIFFSAIGFCAAYAMWAPSRSNSVELAPLEFQMKDAASGRVASTRISALKFDVEKLETGEVLTGQTVKKTVKVSNPTDRPITIVDARGSCGCISLEIPKKQVPPGGSIDMHVRYLALVNAKPGEYGISIETDEAPNVRAALKVHAIPLAIYKLDPVVLLFNVQPGDTELTLTTRMSRTDKQPLAIKSYNSRNPKLTLTWEPDPTAAVPTVLVKCKLDARQISVDTETLVLVTDHPKHSLQELRVSISGTGSVGCLQPVVNGQWLDGGKRLVFNVPMQRFTPGQLEITGVKDLQGRAVKHALTRHSPQNVGVEVEVLDPKAFAENRASGEFEIQTNVLPEPVRIAYLIPPPPVR
jgi:hypothetical protein